MDDSRKYTLREAAVELRRQECRMSGHSWTVLETLGAGPTHVMCTSCGKMHRVLNEAAGAGEPDLVFQDGRVSIYRAASGEFVAADEGGWTDRSYDTLEDAKAAVSVS